MIPTLLFFLIRRLRINHPRTAEKLIAFIRKGSRIIALIILFLTLGNLLSAQENRMQYIIKRNGSEIGNMSLVRKNYGEKTLYTLQTEIKTRFIFLITASGLEEAEFDKGILVSSRLYRKMNGSEKVNKRMTLSGANYIVSKGKKSEVLVKDPIRFTMLNLYDHEPVNVGYVYSDNFQELLKIIQVAPHHYKIKFPDGNYSEYYYRGGICIKIMLHHTLYTASFELK